MSCLRKICFYFKIGPAIWSESPRGKKKCLSFWVFWLSNSKDPILHLYLLSSYATFLFASLHCSAYGFKIIYERSKRNGQVKPGFYLTLRQIERPESDSDLLRFRPSFVGNKPTGLGLCGLISQMATIFK